MLKRVITYTDFAGVNRTETFYFNLSKSELVKMEVSAQGGMQQMMSSIVEKQDGARIMEVFENIIRSSYGEISEDGRRFVKSKALADAFMQTPAYDQLFMELVTDDKVAAAFVNGLLPAEAQTKLEKSSEDQKVIPLTPDEDN